jgi:hypothetical protein
MTTYFKELQLGALNIRLGGGEGWSQLEMGLTTHRSAGMAARETAIRVGFKSDHLLALTGQQNQNDTYITPAGETIYGRISITPAGAIHILSAAQIYAEQVRASVIKSGQQSAAADAAKIAAA